MHHFSWLRHSIQIARAERRRSRRKLGHSLIFRAGIISALAGMAIGSCFLAYTLGLAIQHRSITVPSGLMQAATTVLFFMLLVGSVQRTSKIQERMNIDHLLTTVSGIEVLLGIVLTIVSQIAVPISFVVVPVAVGFGFGVGMLAGTLTIIVALAGLFVLAVTLGVGVSFLIQLIATRSPRFRQYKAFLGFMMSFFAFILYNLAMEERVPIDLIFEIFTVIPTAWFVDLGLVGISDTQSSLLRSSGAFVIAVGGVPVLVAVATALATRVWETEPVSATMSYRSHSLAGKGIMERFFASRVSRPVLTIARKRWLQERRVPLGLLMTGTVWVLFMGVIIPAGFVDEIPGISLIVLVYIFGAGTGLAFGLMVVSTEYSSLLMTLTTVSGEQFIRGQLFAGIAVSVPTTVVVTAILAVMSIVGPFEILLFIIADIVLCICGTTIALAIGMRVSSRDLVPFPIPFVNTIAYDEYGHGTLIRTGRLVGILALVCAPAFGGYFLAFLEIQTKVFGIELATVRIWLLLLTVVMAIGVFLLTYRHAVRLYDDYMIL